MDEVTWFNTKTTMALGSTRLQTVVGGKAMYAVRKILSLQQILITCQLNFVEITKLR